MHRGRLQVQGDDLDRELSWAWASDDPPTVAAALTALDEMKAQLSSAERALREEGFERAARFIERAAGKGGVNAPASRSFKNRRLSGAYRTARVDIEVLTGRAFV